MTICVGTFAADGHAIVCVADRSVTYGDDIMGESDATKIIQLPSGAIALVSGIEGEFERLIAKLARNRNLGKSLQDTIGYCEAQYLEVKRELRKIRLLEPNLTDEEKLREAASIPDANQYIKGLMSQVAVFDISSYILLCGFDESGKAFLLEIAPPGEVRDLSRLGYHAIGSGGQYAISRLVWSEYTRDKPIDEVLYHALDAKISAEINPFIGGEWDAVVVVAGNKLTEVPKGIKKILDRLWVKYDESPYYDRKSDDDPWELPPKDWKTQLYDFAEGILPREPNKSS